MMFAHQASPAARVQTAATAILEAGYEEAGKPYGDDGLMLWTGTVAWVRARMEQAGEDYTLFDLFDRAAEAARDVVK